MKKIICIFSVLLFSGCSKSDNARINSIQGKWASYSKNSIVHTKIDCEKDDFWEFNGTVFTSNKGTNLCQSSDPTRIGTFNIINDTLILNVPVINYGRYIINEISGTEMKLKSLMIYTDQLGNPIPNKDTFIFKKI
jgi:hypothetical protein